MKTTTLKIAAIILLTALSLFSEEAKNYRFNHQKISVGGGVSYFDYSEDINQELYSKLYGYSPKYYGIAKSDEHGFTPSFVVSYEAVLKSTPISIKLTGIISSSSYHTYDGSIPQKNEFFMDTIIYKNYLDEIDTVAINIKTLKYKPYLYKYKDNSFYHFWAQVGYRKEIKNVIITPSLGAKLNLWSRALFFDADSLNETGEFSDEFSEYLVKEDYWWAQIVPAFKVEVNLPQNRVVFAEFMADFMVKGKMDFVNDITTNFTSDRVTLANKFGFTIETGTVKRLSPLFAIVTTPFFQYYQFGLSDIGTQNDGIKESRFVEPDSRSFNFGLKILAQFQFSPKR